MNVIRDPKECNLYIDEAHVSNEGKNITFSSWTWWIHCIPSKQLKLVFSVFNHIRALSLNKGCHAVHQTRGERVNTSVAYYFARGTEGGGWFHLSERLSVWIAWHAKGFPEEKQGHLGRLPVSRQKDSQLKAPLTTGAVLPLLSAVHVIMILYYRPPLPLCCSHEKTLQ
jgi:hypothetical protein